MPTNNRLATASVSLGKPEGGHRIETILGAAAKHGIAGIEMVHDHLVDYALREYMDTSECSILRAARDVRRQSDSLGLKIIALQPFALFEGLLDHEQHKKMIQKMRHWIDLAHALGADMIQMPSNFSERGITGNIDIITADLIELADLTASASPTIRLAYEAVAWGTFVDVWEQSWDIAKRVNRPNFGLCLDTFHIAGRVWADPCSDTGKTASADADLEASLTRMKRELTPDKIFYLQLSDAEKLTPPLRAGHKLFVEGSRPRMLWSRGARLFPCEEDRGGYLPIPAIASTIINDVGYRGWVSMEIFSKRLQEPGSSNIPDEYAKRAARSYHAMQNHLNSAAIHAQLKTLHDEDGF